MVVAKATAPRAVAGEIVKTMFVGITPKVFAPAAIAVGLATTALLENLAAAVAAKAVAAEVAPKISTGLVTLG